MPAQNIFWFFDRRWSLNGLKTLIGKSVRGF